MTPAVGSGRKGAKSWLPLQRTESPTERLSARLPPILTPRPAAPQALLLPHRNWATRPSHHEYHAVTVSEMTVQAP